MRQIMTKILISLQHKLLLTSLTSATRRMNTMNQYSMATETEPSKQSSPSIWTKLSIESIPLFSVKNSIIGIMMVVWLLQDATKLSNGSSPSELYRCQITSLSNWCAWTISTDMESSIIGEKNRISIAENSLMFTTMKRPGTPSIRIVLGTGMGIIWITNLLSSISCLTIHPEKVMKIFQLRLKIHCLIGIHQRFMFINITNRSMLSLQKTLLGSIPITIRYIDHKSCF